MLAMYATGFLLWYGERDTTYRFAGTVMVHDWGTLILMFLVAGHLYLAVLHPATRHALRGMTLGDVDEDVGAQAPREVGRASPTAERAAADR